jgi:hypothetical protein
MTDVEAIKALFPKPIRQKVERELHPKAPKKPRKSGVRRSI